MMPFGYEIIAIALAAIVGFSVGMPWYRSLEKYWLIATGLTKEQLKANETPTTFAVDFLSQVIIAIVLTTITMAMGSVTIINTMIVALMVWFGFVVTTMATNHRFQGRQWLLTLIDSGFWFFVFLAQSIVIGWMG